MIVDAGTCRKNKKMIYWCNHFKTVPMKRIITTIIVPCIAILLAGCSNTLDDSFNGDFEDVFQKRVYQCLRSD